MSSSIGVRLCSVAFRHLSLEGVAEVAAGSAVEGIEWGGDVHVEPGDTNAAQRARRICDDLGLEIPSYGSYLGSGLRLEPEAVLDTAVELGAPNVRIWASASGGEEDPVGARARAVGRIAGWCDLAAARGLTLSTERHGGSLTTEALSARRLIDEVDRPNLWTYWQPLDRGHDAGDEDLADLDLLVDRLSHVHVFWWHDALRRFPLADGARFWSDALARADAGTAWPDRRWAFLEFVLGDDPTQMAADAEVLAGLVRS